MLFRIIACFALFITINSIAKFKWSKKMTNYAHRMNCIKNRIPIISNKFSEKIIKPPFSDEYEWEDGDIPWEDEEYEPWEDGEVPWDEPNDNRTSIKKFPTKKPTRPPVSNHMLAMALQ